MTEAPQSLPVPAVMEASKAMLQKQLYAIFTTPSGDMGPILQHLEEHLDFQVSLSATASCLRQGRCGRMTNRNGAATAW